jgi:hypothetical protein
MTAGLSEQSLRTQFLLAGRLEDIGLSDTDSPLASGLIRHNQKSVHFRWILQRRRSGFLFTSFRHVRNPSKTRRYVLKAVRYPDVLCAYSMGIPDPFLISPDWHIQQPRDPGGADSEPSVH